MANKEQWVFNSVKEEVDPMVFQRIVSMVSPHIRNEQMLHIFLGICTYNPKKQSISILEWEDTARESDTCMLCENAVDMNLVAYRYTDENGIIKEVYCKEEEAEALAGV